MSRLIFDADTLGGTTTLSSADAVGNFTITVPAVNGTMSVKDASGDATFRNITLTGAVLAGAWNGSTIAVAYGGTGATTLTGYVKGNGTSAMTASTTIPNTDITGLGTMSTQNANAVAISGGTISGLSAAIPVGSGGTGATTLTGYVKGNGASVMTASSTIPNTDITGLGTMSTQGSDAVTITGGTANGLTIGGVNPAAGIFTTLRFNSTLSANGNTGTAGQVLTSNGASAPTWQSVAGVGTVTSVDGSGGTTGLTLTGGPITSSGTLTLGGTLAAVNGGTGQSSYAVGNLLYASTTTALSKLAIGTTGQVLTVAGGVPSWATPTTGTVTSVAGTGTVNGLTLTGTVTSSGNLTLGGTLSLVSPPAIGSTTPNTGAFTTLTASTSLTVADNVFTLQDDADPTKQAQFQLSPLATGTTVTYTMPLGIGGAATLADLQTSQTFSGVKSFSAASLNLGSSVVASTVNMAYGATTTGLTKTVNIGTSGLSGSTTTIAIGSSVSGATSTTTLNGTSLFAGAGYSANFALTDAATVAWDTTNQVATFTFVSSNRTMGAPTNLKNGAFYALAVIQNAGSNTLTWNSVFKWAAGTAPTLSTAAGAKDYFTFRSDGTNLYQQGISQAVA